MFLIVILGISIVSVPGFSGLGHLEPNTNTNLQGACDGQGATSYCQEWVIFHCEINHS